MNVSFITLYQLENVTPAHLILVLSVLNVSIAVSNPIKVIVTMISLAIAYVVFGNVMSNVISNAPLNGDDNLVYALVGLGVGVYVSHKQEWIH